MGMQSVQGQLPTPCAPSLVPSPAATVVTTSLCLLPELVSVDSLYFRTCLLTRTHAHTAGHWHMLCTLLYFLFVRTRPPGHLQRWCPSARLRLLKVCRKPFPSPIAVRRGTRLCPCTHRAPRPFWWRPGVPLHSRTSQYLLCLTG